MKEKILFERVTKRGNIKAEFVEEAVEKLKEENLKLLKVNLGVWDKERLVGLCNSNADKIFGEFK